MNVARVRNWGLIIFVVLILAYITQVIIFEVQLGVNQPENQSTIVIATYDADGARSERVVRLVEIDDKPYIAANHWPRAWYHQALANPSIEVDFGEGFAPYTAVALEGEADAMVRQIYTVNFNFRFRTGFPPRYFMRLGPRS